MIVFGSWGGGSGGPIWRVSQAGGTATPLTETTVPQVQRAAPASISVILNWPALLKK